MFFRKALGDEHTKISQKDLTRLSGLKLNGRQARRLQHIVIAFHC